ncbi:probable 4-coumarate--CoA ligase 1 [Topomyia yanbarensis]|uniref:probable 4-coumarate--CoA ligase 1 n=1 Tax=Topomyia yanbarensis TaxID=2498891 RepID=UPI00273B56E5|nr:probable 4-coumarate--CoA ligase 1 [Topomyia yanbarensis]XP_058829050.1 probable 4-coumarate--CoA ligase 1 [Topomyia yanbarensis]
MRSPRNIHTFYNPQTKTWSGSKTPPLYNPHQSLGELILAILKKNPTKVTQISADCGTEVTCLEMRLRTIRVAQHLTAMGYAQQDVFAMAVRNGNLVAPTIFACFALGIPVNTLDGTFKRDEFSFMLETVKPKLVFCDRETLDEMLGAIKMAAIDAVVIIFGEKVDGFLHIEELIKPTGKEHEFVPVHFEDASSKLAIIVCSSGTTGRSKGVCFSHSMCIASIVGMLDCNSTDILLGFSSLYWLSGLAFLLLGTVSGATRIITRHPFEPTLALDIIERFRVTLAFFPPANATALIKHPRTAGTDFSSMRLWFSGGGMVSGSLKNSFEKLTPAATFHVGYGLSEAGGIVSLSDYDSYKEGCTGYLKGTCQARVIDDAGNTLDIGQEGEILVKLDYMFLGYYGNSEATSEMLDGDGWLHTGDIGRFDEDGLLFIVDRKKDIIKYNNYQISPSEIERVILQVPGVANVCVVGIPVPGNDLPAALVTSTVGVKITKDDIMKIVESDLSNYKHLRGGVYIVDTLPMTPSGKVVRRKCRDIAVELYNNCSKVK